LNRTRGIATVTVKGVAVIANLAWANDAVSANDIPGAGASWGASPVGFDTADAIATIAGQNVPVVALLRRLVDPITARRRILGHATGGTCAITNR
jgi:hypothetical protein